MTMHRRRLLAARGGAPVSGKSNITSAPPPAPDAASLAGGSPTVSRQLVFPDDQPAGLMAPPAGETVSFSIPVATYDARMTFSLRAHVDRDGDGRVSAGDLISTTHNPVLTHGAGTVVDVPLRAVN